jgi:hypothetical protein
MTIKYLYTTEITMVNTFVVDRDFAVSASKLDRARLGKQRVEALQILNILQDLRYCAHHFGLPFTGLHSQILDISRRLKLDRKNGNVIYVDADGTYVDADGASKGREVKLGFCFHPAVKMWYSHEDSLKNYINAHIQEFVKRGYRSTMKVYEHKDVSPPGWCTDELFKNHRHALMQKEILRNEAPHYIHMEDFACYAGVKFGGYTWAT